MIDLRSDTVTKPTAAMRRAMHDADVGDDVYGEDPTALALEARVAAMLGKEAARFVPSGTMANQIALLVHCRPGDEVITSEGAHCAFYESGAGAAWAGVQFVTAGAGVIFSPEALDAAAKPDAYWCPRTRLLTLENTHNRGGGKVLPQDRVEALCAHARARGYATHLDGARLFNASVASGRSVGELAAPFDTVSVCLSKGLGAPVGSLLAGTREHVRAATRLRKMLGGGMRQVGVLAAAGLEPDSVDGFILGGDSAFELDGTVYGKPHEAHIARERWLAQRGRSGVLHSGHWLIDHRGGRLRGATGRASHATVHFADDIETDEIDAYIATGEPLKVAGAFTIDSKGAGFIDRIEGDPHTVVGLSVPLLRKLVHELGGRWTDLWNR